jgi:fructuronate reductase
LIRLANATLRELPPSVQGPSYDRDGLHAGIVHLGIGAFHRAHQAVYTDAALAAGDLRWGILGVSLRSPLTRDALAPQDGLYTVDQRGETNRLTVIGSVLDVLVAPEDPAALIAALSHPDVAIVSLTVTEKGYCRDPASGELDETYASIRYDIGHPEAPRTALGLIAAGIEHRRAIGLPPFTVLCCDNLPSNGTAVHRLLARFAALRSADLGRYVEDSIVCPDTMVDRIVPATSAADRAQVAAALGMDDAWPVIAEPFSQWVIEDRFRAGRPEWERAGATLVTDVAPFEAMKLRLLNASHSALAYLSCLAGYETVADAIANPALAQFIEALMADASATLSLPPGTGAAAYRRSLLERFRNPALRHRTAQIAMDGSQKLPPRILAPLRDRLARGLPIDRHALAIAAWMRYVTGVDERGSPIEVLDPMAETLRAVARPEGPVAKRLAPALLSIAAIFGEDLGRDPRVCTAVTAALEMLYRDGAVRAAMLAT